MYYTMGLSGFIRVFIRVFIMIIMGIITNSQPLEEPDHTLIAIEANKDNGTTATLETTVSSHFY